MSLPQSAALSPIRTLGPHLNSPAPVAGFGVPTSVRCSGGSRRLSQDQHAPHLKIEQPPAQWHSLQQEDPPDCGFPSVGRQRVVEVGKP